MSDRAPILEVSGLGKRFGGFVALESINLTVATGERLGLIGPNGSGKSTLVNCLSGTLHHDSGSIVFDGRPIDGLTAPTSAPGWGSPAAFSCQSRSAA